MFPSGRPRIGGPRPTRISGDQSASGDLDEVQYAGSDALHQREWITESLAGRAAMLRLPPLSEREVSGDATRITRILGNAWSRRPRCTSPIPARFCHLSGLKDPGHAAAGPLGGAIFETAVLMEIVRTFAGRGE